MKKDFLSIDDITKNEIFNVLDLAVELKKKPIRNLLSGKVLCLLFEKPSTRTRVSFESGINQLGGSAIYLDATTTQISRGESVEDTAKVLDRYVDAIIARVFSHKTLEIMSKHTNAHVINALSDLEHPCQILSDLLTIRERFHDFESLKLVYIGDGNNVCNSLILGCAKVGIDIAVACPKGYEPNRNTIELARNYTKVSKSRVIVGTEPKEMVKDANIIYTDTWVSMGQESEKKERIRIFKPKYQINNKLFKIAASDVVFMHPLPAYRGKEVTSDIIDGPRSIVFDQAGNRLPVQKALLVKMMVSGRGPLSTRL
ncbi:MAG: ornithine carbamoyltransferase [Candidatus Aenigmarchaeota archaeon]|nr:ornithine carbamoyltransferase [Candidatus Aenigmarchaeota archaeon]